MGKERKDSDIDSALDDLLDEEDSDSVSESSSEDLDLDDLVVSQPAAAKKK